MPAVSDLPDKKSVVVATHPRSGTHLTIDLLRRNFAELKSRKRRLEPLDTLYVPIDIAIIKKEAGLARVVELINRHQHPIIKTHWLQANYANLPQAASFIGTWLDRNAKFVYVIRHPRKVLASHYQFERMFSTQITDPKQWLEESARKWVYHVESWSKKPETKTLRFEDIIKRPQETINELGDYLGWTPKPQSQILPPKLSSKWQGRWYRVFSTDAPSTEILTRGQGATFEQLFQDVDLTQFEQIVRPLEEQFGYATTGT